MAPGVFMVDGMSLQIPPGEFVISEVNGEPQVAIKDFLLRFDLWPMWLEIGCSHAATAADVSRKLDPDLDDASKAALARSELQEAMVAVTALAFAVDGFYGVLQEEMGRHPDHKLWRQKREGGERTLARHKQVVETLRHHLKLGPQSSKSLSLIVQQLFDFRGRSVHPKADFVRPNYRPELDSGVHPHLITFSGPHAVQARALVLVALDTLVDRAAQVAGPDVDRGWLVKGREELDRLLRLYRVPGDEVPAWSEHLVMAQAEV